MKNSRTNSHFVGTSGQDKPGTSGLVLSQSGRQIEARELHAIGPGSRFPVVRGGIKNALGNGVTAHLFAMAVAED